MKTTKNARERYQSLSKEEKKSNYMIVNDIEIYQKTKKYIYFKK